MIGHTDKGTINQRRPLSAGMATLLKALDERDIDHSNLSTAEKNRMRGLMDRGYAVPSSGPKNHWSITPAGREARRVRPVSG